MRPLERIERIMFKLGRLWVQFPDQRLGQLLENYVFGYNSLTNRQVFHVEDDDVEKQLTKLLNKLAKEEKKRRKKNGKKKMLIEKGKLINYLKRQIKFFDVESNYGTEKEIEMPSYLQGVLRAYYDMIRYLNNYRNKD